MTAIDAISQLNKVFKSKNWHEKDTDEFVFHNFCKLLENLENDERELLIELIERYEWISFSQYPKRILASLESIEEEKINQIKTIYLFPVIKVEDEGGFKSGSFLIYQIKALKNQLKKYSKITFKYVSKFDFFSQDKFKLKPNEAIFLIDDYVGSGETLNDCLQEIRGNAEITNDKLCIFTIAAQRETIEAFDAEGIAFYSDFRSLKGISDFNETPLREEKIDLMLKMEKMIPGGSHFSLGYNGCEALITLARTPDNTFPIFWKKYRKGKQSFDAPFSREDTIEY
ncbi:hypothetical protein [Flagellimonas marinaquae]|uniref:phosphoribosyltransferase-like protein n=1 Tax=Flagellimonas marinaquae TaxID=254955 RepID=UPI0020753258|nr:hypothetical protein [Allomuricauda aquimarina]USD26229.1 hypothetical protein MJO53_04895 [Allomuricauda aquimarina]